MKLVEGSDGNQHAVPDDYLRLCKNCANVVGNRHSLGRSDAKCAAKQNLSGQDLVTGESLYHDALCGSQRNDSVSTHCGLDGRWFILYIYPVEQYKKDKPVNKSPLINLGMGDD